MKRDIARSIRLAGASLMFELSIVSTPDIEEVVAWKAEFERSGYAGKYQIAGFRNAANGSVNAIIVKRN